MICVLLDNALIVIVTKCLLKYSKKQLSPRTNFTLLQQSQVNCVFSGRVDKASATEVVDTGSIPGRVKPKTIKIGIYSFPA